LLPAIVSGSTCGTDIPASLELTLLGSKSTGSFFVIVYFYFLAADPLTTSPQWQH